MMVTELKDIIAAVGGLLGIAAMLFSWLTARSRANASELDDISKRVTSVENEIKHIPSKDVVHQLELSISKIEGDIHAMSEAFKAVERTAVRIESFLLNGSKASK